MDMSGIVEVFDYESKVDFCFILKNLVHNVCPVTSEYMFKPRLIM